MDILKENIRIYRPIIINKLYELINIRLYKNKLTKSAFTCTCLKAESIKYSKLLHKCKHQHSVGKFDVEGN